MCQQFDSETMHPVLCLMGLWQTAQSLSLLCLPQERNIAICYTNASLIPEALGIVMTPIRGQIHRGGSIRLQVYVPSSINFTNIEYTVVGDANGIGPGLNHVDGNAPPSQAELKSGIGELMVKIPPTKDNKFYIKTLLRQHGYEIRCVNTFAFFQQAVKSSKNFIGSTAEQDVLDAEISQAGLSTVAVIGIVCGLLGVLLIGIIIGAFFGVKYQLKRQKIEIQLLGGSDEKDSIHLLKINNLENQLESNEKVSISLPTININNSTNTGTFIND